MNISSVASSLTTTPTYQQTAVSSKSNPLQSVENAVSDIASVAAKAAPAIGVLGTLVDIFV